MRYTRQFDRMDCGPACVRMIASHFGRTYPLSYLRPLARLTREGVSIAGICLRSSFQLKAASFMPENCSKNQDEEKLILTHIDNQ
ncbi:MAG: hypothetical protein HDR75_03070 [Bacteroides sp.]|nr:hypothetical protein [Bacteroides sp.]